MENIKNIELLVEENLLDKFIEKLIEDTKSDKLEWDKFDISPTNVEKYCAEIEGIGTITIEYDVLYHKNGGIMGLFSSILEELLTFRIGDDLEIHIDATQNRDYYVNLKRLYNLAQHRYLEKRKKLLQNPRLTQAITAYINAD